MRHETHIQARTPGLIAKTLRAGGWPIGRAGLATLIDIGLSDRQIGAYFLVTSNDVYVVRSHHDPLTIRPNEEEHFRLCMFDVRCSGHFLEEAADGLARKTGLLPIAGLPRGRQRYVRATRTGSSFQ